MDYTFKNMLIIHKINDREQVKKKQKSFIFI